MDDGLPLKSPSSDTATARRSGRLRHPRRRPPRPASTKRVPCAAGSSCSQGTQRCGPQLACPAAARARPAGSGRRGARGSACAGPPPCGASRPGQRGTPLALQGHLSRPQHARTAQAGGTGAVHLGVMDAAELWRPVVSSVRKRQTSTHTTMCYEVTCACAGTRSGWLDEGPGGGGHNQPTARKPNQPEEDNENVVRAAAGRQVHAHSPAG